MNELNTFFTGCTKSFTKSEKLYENFLNVIFGILFIFVPPKQATIDPVFCLIRRKWLTGVEKFLEIFCDICNACKYKNNKTNAYFIVPMFLDLVFVNNVDVSVRCNAI